MVVTAGPVFMSSCDMPTAASPLTDIQGLRELCATASFRPGDVLREQGQYYRSMYWLTDGLANVEFKDGSGARATSVGAGWPIGEISFLRGSPAVATVTAAEPTSALVIDNVTLALLERKQPALAVRFLRLLADIADDRTNSNMTFAGDSAGYTRGPAIDIRLCRTQGMLEAAQRLRYEVYCQELGRQSPFADYGRKVIADDLDDVGYVFVAMEAGEVIGTLRVNFPADGSLGLLEDVYGMKQSPHHPDRTSVCTKFIVKKSKRKSAAACMLICAIARHCTQNGKKELYIDCIPALLPYYKAIGFKIASESFYHRENGPSYPMVITDKYKDRWIRDFGPRQYLMLYVKAKVIKYFDALRGTTKPAAARATALP
jgi:predicted GNAT family N-acyltransferase